MSKTLISVGNIQECIDYVKEIEKILKRLEFIKSYIGIYVSNENMKKPVSEQIQKEDYLNYRLCNVFIPKVERYLKEFQSVYTDETFFESRTRYLEKQYLFRTIKIFIQDMENFYNIK